MWLAYKNVVRIALTSTLVPVLLSAPFVCILLNCECSLQKKKMIKLFFKKNVSDYTCGSNGWIIWWRFNPRAIWSFHVPTIRSEFFKEI